ASFVAALVGILLMAGFAPIIAEVALGFGSAEYFSLMVLGLLAAALLGQGSPVRSVVMVVLGLLIGIIGTDVNSGQFRFTFGIPELAEGANLVAVAMGLFGVSEVIANAGRIGRSAVNAKDITWRSLIPSGDDLRRSWRAVLRGSGIGAGFGILPGTGAA